MHPNSVLPIAATDSSPSKDQAIQQPLKKLPQPDVAGRLEPVETTALMEKLQRVESRLIEIEKQMHASSNGHGTATFFMAMLAAGMAALAVPWEEVPHRTERWKERLNRAMHTASQTHANSTDTPHSTWPRHGSPTPKSLEPVLPDTSAEGLSDALLLLPLLSEKPKSLPPF